MIADETTSNSGNSSGINRRDLINFIGTISRPVVSVVRLADDPDCGLLNSNVAMQVTVPPKNNNQDDGSTSVAYKTRDIVENLCPSEWLWRVACRALPKSKTKQGKGKHPFAGKVIRLKYGDGYETIVGIDKEPTDDDEVVELSVGLSMAQSSSFTSVAPSDLGCVMSPKETLWDHLSSNADAGGSTKKAMQSRLIIRTDCPSWIEVSGGMVTSSETVRRKALVIWSKSKNNPFSIGRIQDVTEKKSVEKTKKKAKKASTGTGNAATVSTPVKHKPKSRVSNDSYEPKAATKKRSASSDDTKVGKKKKIQKEEIEEETEERVTEELTKPAHKKTKKDPNAPKRNMNAYMLFSNAKRKEIKAANPDAKFLEMGSLIGDEWKKLDDKERKVWENKASEDKKRYEQEMEKYSPPEDPKGESIEGASEKKEEVQEESTKSAQKKPKKDPNAPKRNLNAYMLFSNAKRKEIKAANPDAKFLEMGSLIGDEWKKLDDKERKVWENKASEDKKRYEQEMENYSPPENQDGESVDGNSKQMAVESTKSPQKKSKKDPNAPKKNRSAYNLYSAFMIPEIKDLNPGATFGQLSQLVSEQFKKLSNKERSEWEKKAADDKERYSREMAEYGSKNNGGAAEAPKKLKKKEIETAQDAGDDTSGNSPKAGETVKRVSKRKRANVNVPNEEEKKTNNDGEIETKPTRERRILRRRSKKNP